MKKRMVEMTCPWCQNRFYILRDTMILDDGTGIESERLMNSAFFTHSCSNCRNLFEMSYPLLLRNHVKGFCLFLSRAESLPEVDEPLQIRCRTPEEFEFVYQALMLQLNLKKAASARKLLLDQGIHVRKILPAPENCNKFIFDTDQGMIAFDQKPDNA